MFVFCCNLTEFCVFRLHTQMISHDDDDDAVRDGADVGVRHEKPVCRNVFLISISVCCLCISLRVCIPRMFGQVWICGWCEDINHYDEVFCQHFACARGRGTSGRDTWPDYDDGTWLELLHATRRYLSDVPRGHLAVPPLDLFSTPCTADELAQLNLAGEKLLV